MTSSESLLKSLTDLESLHLKRYEALVRAFVEEEQLLSSRLLELEKALPSTPGQRLADSLAAFGGSWFFICSFFLLLASWIFINIYGYLAEPFDPYPFILLNLVLSCLGAIQAPIIMMSQNRQEEKDRARSRNDFLINMKAEMEVRSMHAKMDLLLTDQMRSLFEVQEAQLASLRRIEDQLASK